MLFDQVLTADPDVVALQEVTPRFMKLLKESALAARYHSTVEPLHKVTPTLILMGRGVRVSQKFLLLISTLTLS